MSLTINKDKANEAPEIQLLVTEWGQTRAEPFPRFYLRDDRAFFEFCVANSESTLRFEREPDGEVTLIPPSGSQTGKANGIILARLFIWNETNGSPGYVFDAWNCRL